MVVFISETTRHFYAGPLKADEIAVIAKNGSDVSAAYENILSYCQTSFADSIEASHCFVFILLFFPFSLFRIGVFQKLQKRVTQLSAVVLQIRLIAIQLIIINMTMNLYALVVMSRIQV